MKKLLLFIFLSHCFFSLNAQDDGTNGTEFWLAYMENLTLIMNGSPQFSVYVTSATAGNATITAPATGLTFSFSYPANHVTEFIFPPGILYAMGSEEVKNFGFRINTSTPANVFAVHYRLYFTEASMLLPMDVLGDEYYISAGKDFNGSSPSSFVVVATEDNTEIEITPASNTANLRPAGVPFTVLLDEGQSYQVQSLGDLTGSKVASVNGSKLAVFGGARQADINCNPADSHLYDQLYPVSYASKSYALIPFKEQGNSLFKILAIEDSTEIMINGNSFATLQSGEFTEVNYDIPHMLSSNKNVHVTQFSPSFQCATSGIGDPNMLQLHSSEYRIKSMLFENLLGFSGSPSAFTKQCLTLFTETTNTSQVFIDNVNVSADFQVFPGDSTYSFAMLTLPPGISILEAPEGVMAYAYGFGSFDAYTYSLGFDPSPISSTTDVPLDFDLQIFPNPTFDQVSIVSSEIIDEIELFDVSGRMLHSIKVEESQSELSLHDFASGIYILQIKSGDSIMSKRISKM